MTQQFLKLKSLLIILLFPQTNLFAAFSLADGLISFACNLKTFHIKFLDDGLVPSFQAGDLSFMLTRFLSLVGQFLSEVCHFILKLFVLDDIGVGLTGLEGGGLDFHLEVSDVGLRLFDVVFGIEKVLSYLAVVQV
jgi:hypothetical protein